MINLLFFVTFGSIKLKKKKYLDILNVFWECMLLFVSHSVTSINQFCFQNTIIVFVSVYSCNCCSSVRHIIVVYIHSTVILIQAYIWNINFDNLKVFFKFSCHLRKSKLEACNLVKCNLVKCKLEKLQFGKRKFCKKSYSGKSNLRNFNYGKCNLEKLNLEKCNLGISNFGKIQFRKVLFRKIRFGKTLFEKVLNTWYFPKGL